MLLLSFLVLSVFLTEALVMGLLRYLPSLSPATEAVVDAVLLIVLLLPVLYLLLFRPMKAHIQEHQRIEDALRENEEEQYRVMVHHSLDGFWVADVQGRFLEVNDAYCQMMGYRRDELLSMCVSDVEAMETPEETARHIQKVIESGGDYFETRHRRKDGRLVDVEASVNFSPFHGGRFYCFLRNISERKRIDEQLREDEARLKEMFENLRSGVAVYRPSEDGGEFVFTAFNRAAELIENISRQDVLGRSVVELFPGIIEFGLLDVLRRVWQSGNAEHFPQAFYKDGRISGWRENYIYKLPNGEIVAIYDDVTKEKQVEEQMQYLAHHDILTGLSNRTLFIDRCRQALASAKRSKAHLALLFLDLDRFKPVNDSLGHEAGDLVLREVARRLQVCVRESDTVARMGGDEFVVLLATVESTQDALLVAEKIMFTIAQPYEFDGHAIHISSSVGVALYPEHGGDKKTLLKNADIAMYYAKASGRNNVQIYQPEMVSSRGDAG
ncbi:MAG: diguanylate cyclase [Nitrosomonadales bacterium]|nr:diguanylate cyclase [Nitrosomonadales bacterium]